MKKLLSFSLVTVLLCSSLMVFADDAISQDDFKTRLQNAITSGKLTQEKADSILEKLNKRFDKMNKRGNGSKQAFAKLNKTYQMPDWYPQMIEWRIDEVNKLVEAEALSAENAAKMIEVINDRLEDVKNNGLTLGRHAKKGQFKALKLTDFDRQVLKTKVDMPAWYQASIEWKINILNQAVVDEDVSQEIVDKLTERLNQRLEQAKEEGIYLFGSRGHRKGMHHGQRRENRD